MMAPVFCQVMTIDSTFSTSEFFFQPKKVKYGITIGTQFSSITGFGSALNTYVVPHVSYNLNKRLRFGGGISIIQTNYFQTGSRFRNEQADCNNGNFTSAMIFVDGQYIVNERLTISGSAFKQFPVSKDPLPYNPFSPVSSRGAQGIDFNVGYRIGDHAFIQAGFRYSDGINSYPGSSFYQNPFMNNSFGTEPGPGIPHW